MFLCPLCYFLNIVLFNFWLPHGIWDLVPPIVMEPAPCSECSIQPLTSREVLHFPVMNILVLLSPLQSQPHCLFSASLWTQPVTLHGGTPRKVILLSQGDSLYSIIGLFEFMNFRNMDEIIMCLLKRV